MIRLVDDLLDVSRIARGKIVLLSEPVKLAEVVAAAVETVQPLLEQKRQQLQIEATDRSWRCEATRCVCAGGRKSVAQRGEIYG
jgi:signal transduction histidine kinase